MAEGLNIVTGIETDETSLRQIAGRIFTVERAFGVREGISKKDDYIFGKTGDEAVPGGTFKGERLDTAKFTKMLEEYYAIRGWDVATGIPTRSILEKYGLPEIAAELGQFKEVNNK